MAMSFSARSSTFPRVPSAWHHETAGSPGLAGSAALRDSERRGARENHRRPIGAGRPIGSAQSERQRSFLGPSGGVDDEEGGPDSSVAGPILRHNKTIFAYGNYDPYYKQRHDVMASMDPRVEALLQQYGPDVFENRSVLDLGCGTGFVTFQLASLGVKCAEGVDIDLTLVSKALRQLRRFKSAGCRVLPTAETGTGRFPLSLAASRGIVPHVAKTLLANPILSARSKLAATLEPSTTFLETSQAAIFPMNVEFRTANVLTSDVEERRGMAYDMILCLKLTMWAHLHWGDDGLKTLFTRCYRLLKPGGLLVLEAQEWDSYQTCRHLTPHTRQNRSMVMLRPNEFSAYLVDVVGFETPTPIGQCPPLDRPMLLYRRPGPDRLFAPHVELGAVVDAVLAEGATRTAEASAGSSPKSRPRQPGAETSDEKRSRR